MTLDLSTLVLHRGAHASTPEFCVMEATAVWLGEPKKDRNVDDVCPRIEAYTRALNDAMPDDQRQRLVAFIPRLPNTRAKTKKQDNTRRWMLQEVATKVFASYAMRSAGLIKEADILAEAKITDAKSSNKWAARAAEAAEAAEAARATWAAEAAEAARATWAAEATEAAWAAEAAEVAWVAGEAAWVAGEVAWAAEGEIWDMAISLLDDLIKVTEEA